MILILKLHPRKAQFDLELLSNSNPIDEVTNQIAWGGNCSVDLSKIFLLTI